MPAALTVPTIFTAVDRLSAVVSRMSRNVTSFAGRSQAALGRVNKAVNGMIPLYSSLRSSILHYAGGFAIAAGIIGAAGFGAHAILEHEKAVAGLRGILNKVSNNDFQKFRDEILLTARVTQYSATEVADAFTKISERNIALAKTPKSLGDVTKAAITLSRAAKIELVDAADAIVNVLFQFDLLGKDSNRVINVLAAGMVKGSSSIQNQIEAYKKFAVTAKGAHVSLEQSNALIQTVAHQVQGSDAGTALRNIILNLQKYKAVYKDGAFDIVFALEQTRAKLKSLSTEQKQNLFLQELFDKRQVNVARQLLNNIPLFKRLATEVTGTSEAFRMADKNTDTVIGQWDKLKAAYSTALISGTSTQKGLNKLKNTLKYLTDNMDGLLDGLFTTVKWFLIWKALVKGTAVVMGAYNIVLGITGALTGVVNVAVGQSTIALTAYKVATRVATLANLAYNVSLSTMIPLLTTTRGIFAGWGVTAAGIGKTFYWITYLYLAVQAMKNLVDSWEGIKKSFSNGQWIVGFSQALRAGVIMPLIELAKMLDTAMKFVGVDMGLHFPETAQDKAEYIATGGWGQNKDENRLLLPPTTNMHIQAQKQQEAYSGVTGSIGINIIDPSGYVGGASSKGNIDIPVKVTSTTGRNNE